MKAPAPRCSAVGLGDAPPPRDATRPEAGLAAADRDRVARALDKLRRNGLAGFALTGGVATAAHLAAGEAAPRPLNDLDVVVGGNLPATLADDLLVSHVHPDARPGGMALQLVEPSTALRVDLFGGVGGQLERSVPGPAAFGDARVVSRADLVARFTRLLLDLALDETVPKKHARDLAALAREGEVRVRAAWSDHRRDRHPRCFDEARREVDRLVRDRAHLLVSPAWTSGACPRCRDGGGFRIAPAERIVAVLGYR